MEGLNYGFWLTALVMLAYTGVSIDLVCRGNYALSLVFASYAIGNIGFLLIMR